jgi:hypothetical protein
VPRRIAIPPLPMHIGRAEFRSSGALVAVRCPSELEPFIRSAGGEWDTGARHWLIERRRVGPLVRRGLRRDRSVVPRGSGPVERRAGARSKS